MEVARRIWKILGVDLVINSSAFILPHQHVQQIGDESNPVAIDMISPHIFTFSLVQENFGGFQVQNQHGLLPSTGLLVS